MLASRSLSTDYDDQSPSTHSSDDDSESGELDCEPNSEEIDIVVAHIKRLSRTASLEFALRVGAVIIHHFYAGDANAWRSHGPKTASFRRLSRHPNLPLSAGALYRCVAVYELCDRLNAASRWEHLSVSHLRLVLGLPSSTQERLLASANSQRVTVKALQEAVLREKATTSRTRGGRLALPPITKGLSSLRKSLTAYQQILADVSGLSPREREQSVALLDETRACLESLSDSLRVAGVHALQSEARASRAIG